MQSINEWAAAHNISQFVSQFIDAGFDTIPVLSELDTDDLDWMKINKPGDRKKILRAVRELAGQLSLESENAEEEEIIDVEHDPTMELVIRETSREMNQGRASVLEWTDMLSALSPMLSQGHRVNEGNPLYVATCMGDRNEVSRLVGRIKEGRLNVDVNELCGDAKTTVLHTAVGMGG